MVRLLDMSTPHYDVAKRLEKKLSKISKAFNYIHYVEVKGCNNIQYHVVREDKYKKIRDNFIFFQREEDEYFS